MHSRSDLLIDFNTHDESIPPPPNIVAFNVTKIYMNCNLNGFNKSGADVFTTYASIELEFNQFSYIIKGKDRNSERKKLYGDEIAFEERDSIIGAIRKDIIERIKEKTKIVD